MARRHIDVFESTIQKTNLWLKDIERAMRVTDSKPKAYAALRGVLHTLRECMPVDETMKFAAQMPLLVRAVYFDGWKPRRKPVRLTKATFFRELRECLRGLTDVDVGVAARAVFSTVEKHVSRGEVASVRRVLPSEIRTLWADLTREQRTPAPAAAPADEFPFAREAASGETSGESYGREDLPGNAWQPGWAARQLGERSGGVTDVRGPR